MGKTTRASAAFNGKGRDKKAIHGGRQKTRSSAQSGDLLDPRESERNEKALKTALSGMGLYAAQTKGDGNCLFRALSDQLWGHDLSHAWLRREICAYLLAHRERCENFVDADGGFDKYVREMQTTGTYGGHLELQVCAWLMRVNIKVIQPTSVYIISPSDESPAPASSVSISAPPATTPITDAVEAGQPGSVTPTTAPNSPSSSLSSLTPSPSPETPAAPSPTASAPAAVAVEEPPAASSSTVNTIYVAYHAYEHYSSVRNIAGPKTGLPCTREIKRPPGAASSGASSRSGSAAATGSRGGEWKTEDADPVPTNEEMLVLSSLPPSAFSLADIRRAATGLERGDPCGESPAWETVVELLLERYEASGGRPVDGPSSSAANSKTAWREVEGLAGTESDASGRTTTGAAATSARGKRVAAGAGTGRGRGRGRGKSRSSLGARVAGRRAGSSPSTASSSEGGSSNLHEYPADSVVAASRSSTSSIGIPGADGDDDDGHERSSPSLSPPPDTPPASPLAAGGAGLSSSGTTRVRLKRPPPSSAGSCTQAPTLGKERRRERKARIDQDKAIRRATGAVGVGLRTRSRATAVPAEKVGEVEGGMREIHI